MIYYAHILIWQLKLINKWSVSNIFTGISITESQAARETAPRGAAELISHLRLSDRDINQRDWQNRASVENLTRFRTRTSQEELYFTRASAAAQPRPTAH